MRIVQVISNLLNNAARYTPPNGAIALTCGLESGSAFVSVRDSGIGIPSELLPSIFDMFVQERTRSDGSGGLGLGLALAKQLVTLHGGNISAHSEGRGTGSTFRMEIPAESALRPRTRSSEFEPLQLSQEMS